MVDAGNTSARLNWNVAQSSGRRRKELPKPTKAMQAHTNLDLDKDSGTTRLVDNEEGNGRGPGFYCEVCKRMCKDSVGYLDHINGRMHLRRLGQTTQASRATLQDVRNRIAFIRSERQLGATPAQRYDFDARLREIAAEQRRERQARRREHREERLRKKRRMNATASASDTHANDNDDSPVALEDADVMAAMGFGSFGPKR